MGRVTRPGDNSHDPRWNITSADGMPCAWIELSDPFDDTTAANIFVPPNHCIVLSASASIVWTPDAPTKFAHRVAGRQPLNYERLPERLAAEFTAAVAAVLDWCSAA